MVIIVRAMEGAMTPEQVMAMDAAFACELMTATGTVMAKARRAAGMADGNVGMTDRNVCPTRQEVGGGRSEMRIGSMAQLREVLKNQRGL